MTSPLVSRKEALAKRTHHQFVPGLGYLAHSGPPDLPATANGAKNCDPPKGTRDGSLHLIKPPNGGPSQAFTWIAAEKAWAPAIAGRGNRLAWPVDHLRRAGWEYQRAAKPGEEGAGVPQSEQAAAKEAMAKQAEKART